jgi:hypothetical protein
MLDAGVDLRDIQIAARHADPRTTIVRGREKVSAGGQVEVSAGGQLKVSIPRSSCRRGV